MIATPARGTELFVIYLRIIYRHLEAQAPKCRAHEHNQPILAHKLLDRSPDRVSANFVLVGQLKLARRQRRLRRHLGGIVRNDVDASTDHGTDQAFVPEYLDRLLCGASRYPVLLCKTVDRWQRTTRHKLSALYLVSQDRGKLQVNGYVPFVVDLHTGDFR